MVKRSKVLCKPNTTKKEPQGTPRNPCLHCLTFAYISLHLLTFAYICLHFFTFAYSPLHLLTFAYISLHLLTVPSICLQLHTYAYIYRHLLTYSLDIHIPMSYLHIAFYSFTESHITSICHSMQLLLHKMQ